MIKAAIFDMDGLMIDSDHIISKAYAKVLDVYGVKPKLNSRGVVYTPGISSHDNFSDLVRTYNIDEDVDKLAKKKNELQTELVKQGVDVLPGIEDLLRLLSQHKVKMAIGSSSKREYVDEVIRQLNIGHYFEAVITGDDVAQSKPSPDIFLAAAEKISVAPEECVVFEDAFSGVQAAKAAGMKCIAVPAKGELDDPKFSKADLVFSSLVVVNWNVLTELA